MKNKTIIKLKIKTNLEVLTPENIILIYEKLGIFMANQTQKRLLNQTKLLTNAN